MSPNEKADDGDSDTGGGDEGVAEDRFAREGRNDFADDAHRRKNHDVHRGMGVEPEQMLEQDGVAAHGGIEKAQMQHTLEASKQ